MRRENTWRNLEHFRDSIDSRVSNTRPGCTWYVLEVANIAGRDKPESGDESEGTLCWILCRCSASQFRIETKMSSTLEPYFIMYNTEKGLTAKSDLLP